jgi:maleylpyruvate isomerase
MADAAESSRRFVLDAECMPADRWHTEIQLSSGGSDPPRPIAGIRPLEMRLREVEFHHVDLDAGYSFADTPDSLLERLLADTAMRLGREGLRVQPMPEKSPDRWFVESTGESQTVQGAARDVLAWLSGRSDGADLATAGTLPAVPSLG